MANVTLQDLLDSGVSIEELLFNNEPSEVNVSVDTSNLLELLEKNQIANRELLDGMRKTISENNKDSKDFLVKAVTFLIKNEKEKELTVPAITGINVIRDENDRISDLKFIRD
jgi:hypothetical protein